jgi:glycosyltransferase involved in cell wall biosynthesis
VPELPFLSECHIAVDSRLLLFLGRIETEKGVFVLLEALARARAAGAGWRLVCGGLGDLRRARAAARSFGLSDSDAQFVGWVDGDEKRRLLQSCALLVLPSFIENMPVVVLEAFAYGKPVIATQVGGLLDLVTPGSDGFLVQARDAEALGEVLKESYGDDARLAQMGASARRKVEACYTPAKVLAEVDALYRECLSCKMNVCSKGSS